MHVHVADAETHAEQQALFVLFDVKWNVWAVTCGVAKNETFHPTPNTCNLNFRVQGFATNHYKQGFAWDAVVAYEFKWWCFKQNFSNRRKHTPNWISSETRYLSSFGCNSSLNLFWSVLAPDFKFWCFKKKFAIGENIPPTWFVAVFAIFLLSAAIQVSAFTSGYGTKLSATGSTK